MTPAEKKAWRERDKLSKAFARELEERNKAIAGLETKAPAYDPFIADFNRTLRQPQDAPQEDEYWDDDGALRLAPPNGRNTRYWPTTRVSAMHHNNPEYSTGKPCIDGHHSPRETSSGRCLVCMEEGNQERAEIETRLAKESATQARLRRKFQHRP